MPNRASTEACPPILAARGLPSPQQRLSPLTFLRPHPPNPFDDPLRNRSSALLPDWCGVGSWIRRPRVAGRKRSNESTDRSGRRLEEGTAPAMPNPASTEACPSTLAARGPPSPQQELGPLTFLRPHPPNPFDDPLRNRSSALLPGPLRRGFMDQATSGRWKRACWHFARAPLLTNTIGHPPASPARRSRWTLKQASRLRHTRAPTFRCPSPPLPFQPREPLHNRASARGDPASYSPATALLTRSSHSLSGTFRACKRLR